MFYCKWFVGIWLLLCLLDFGLFDLAVFAVLLVLICVWIDLLGLIVWFVGVFDYCLVFWFMVVGFALFCFVVLYCYASSLVWVIVCLLWFGFMIGWFGCWFCGLVFIIVLLGIRICLYVFSLWLFYLCLMVLGVLIVLFWLWDVLVAFIWFWFYFDLFVCYTGVWVALVWLLLMSVWVLLISN